MAAAAERTNTGMGAQEELRRADGVRILHNPYAPGMAEKYGLPGETDNEGFDPYSDSVGPGITLYVHISFLILAVICLDYRLWGLSHKRMCVLHTIYMCIYLYRNLWRYCETR